MVENKVNCCLIIKDMNLGIQRITINDLVLKERYECKSHRKHLSSSEKHNISLERHWIEERLNWENGFYSDKRFYYLRGFNN